MADEPRSWGRPWLEAVIPERPRDARATSRGAALARRGAVTDLRVEPGRIRADVAEDRVAPYRVQLTWPAPPDGAWSDAMERLSGELRFTAALLEGELPEGVEEVLGDVGIPLLPTDRALTASCSCPATPPWCPHVAAVHHQLAVLLDRDPFQLLWLRGRSRDALLASLRAGRGEPLADAAIDVGQGLFGARGDLDEIPLAPSPPEDPAALLRHLGPPPGVDDLAAFEQIVERTASTAWRLAAGAGAEAAEEELLLAELRGQRTATAASLAEALGRDVEPVREALDDLFDAGVVLRTGSGERTRYRAADT